MRRLLYFLGGAFIVLILLAILLPFFFEDKVNALLKSQINRYLNAQVNYTRLSLSLFRHFPALTVRLENLSIVNKEPFAGDTLLSCEALEVGLDVLKAISGNIAITRFYLIKPQILAQVRSDGRASWDITLPDTTSKTEEKPDTGTTAFKLSLRRYEIQDGYITYWDSSTGIYTRLTGLTHKGKGDFTQDEMLLETDTRIGQLFFTYGNTPYLKGQSLEAGIDLDISFPASRYTLKRGEIRLNALPLSLTGTVSLPDSLTTLLDMKFNASNASLKELLSLIPAAFKKGYESLATEGTLSLEGFVQGEMRDTLLPQFGLNLRIEKGQIRYKDLPKPIQNLEVRLQVQNSASNLEGLSIKLDTFALQIGKTSLQARFQSEGLFTMRLQAAAKGEGDLSDFTSALPLGYEARGTFALDLRAQGIYAEKKLPSVEGFLRLRDGYLKAADFPTPVEKVEIDFSATAPEGLPEKTVAELKRLYAVVAGSPVEVSLLVQNLEALNYSFTAKGAADLDAWTRIFPIDSTELKGKVSFDLKSQGNRQAIEKHDYTRLPTTGTISLQNISYKSNSLPQGLTIRQANLAFSPAYISLTSYQGTLGRSDIGLDGRLENYLEYVLKDEKIIGTLSLKSRRLDLNEWMSQDTTQQKPQTETDTTSNLEVVVLPANIDFTFQASIDELLYEKMVFHNAKGKIILRDQALRLEGFEMKGFGGTFTLSGSYIAPDKNNARWEMKFVMRQVRVEEVSPHFATMRRIAPIVKQTTGQMNFSLSASSKLKPDFMPELSTLSGMGSTELIQATVQGSTSLSALSSAAKMPQLSTLRIANTTIRFKIQNGELQVEPFSFTSGEYKMEVGGVTRLDQTIAYDLGLEVPAGWAQGFLQAAGLPIQGPQRVKLIAELGGTLAQPKVIRVRPQTGDGGVKEALTSRIEEEKARLEAEAKRRKDSIEAALRRKEDSVKQALERKRREEEERLRREAEERRRQEEERLRQEAERRRKEEEERLKQQLEEERKKREEELKKKLPFPR
ncbi:MAG: AsmA-like C-terminal region-containing protein [Bacteroidia bacterium]|nr:AsmA family protein [Bacteroidia bacterium]MDW8134641.1 AsmA-like C-terminal region-containing protein [Bacteroidia bacterium]